MIRKILKVALFVAIAYFVSELPPIADLQDMTLHATAALEAKEVPEGAILNIEPKSAEVEVPETTATAALEAKEDTWSESLKNFPKLVEKAFPRPFEDAFTTSFETIELSGKYKNTNIECIEYLIDENLSKDNPESSSKEVNVFLPGSGGGR